MPPTTRRRCGRQRSIASSATASTRGARCCLPAPPRVAADAADGGESLLRRARALVRPAGTTKTLARCLSALASSRLFAGDLGEAQTLHEEALATYRALGEVAADGSRS